MNTVWQVHVRVSTHALQKEGEQGEPVLIGQLWKYILKLFCVLGAIIGGEFHPGKQNRDIFLLGPLDYFSEVFLGLTGRYPTQAIISTKRNDQKMGRRF